jgi:hypothetical protein
LFSLFRSRGLRASGLDSIFKSEGGGFLSGILEGRRKVEKWQGKHLHVRQEEKLMYSTKTVILGRGEEPQ